MERKTTMERPLHDESTRQPSLFSFAPPPQDKEPYIAENHLVEVPRHNEVYVALDRLLEALEDLLQGGHPLSDELRRRLSNPILEALIIEEMSKSLGLE